MRNKFILWLGISLVCFTAFVLSVRAGEKETVSLNNVNGGIEATLELPVGENQNGTFSPPEEVVAIQLSFQLSGQGSIKKEDVSFEFGSSIPQGVMKEYRYQEDTGVLNIYISGNKNIYNSKNISLGKVVVNSEEKTTVKVVKDSFKTVNSAHGMYEGEVNTGNGGQSINNGGPSGGNADDDDVGEEMRPPEEEEKPDEGSDGQNTGGENSDSGSSGGGSSSGGGHDKKKDKNKPSAGTTGSAQKILDTVLKDPASEDSLESDPDWSLENDDSQEESEEKEPLIPEHSLWEDGAKLWREKTGAIGMDVWTKIFFGLFAGSAAVAGGIGVSMAVRTSGKRKRRKKRRVHGSGSAYAAAKARQQTVHARSRSRQTGKRAEPGRRTSKARQTQRSRTTGRTQSMHTGRERPVWKDNKKPYVRKKRKIG